MVHQKKHLEYGGSRKWWIIGGIVLSLAGLTVITLPPWIIIQFERHRSVGSILVCVFSAILGTLFVANGLVILRKWKNLKIVLCDRLVRIGTPGGVDTFLIEDIERISEGCRCVQLLLREGRLYSITNNYFTSSVERSAFIRDTSEKIERIRRSL